MRRRRELWLAVGLCLLGSALVLLGVTRAWGTATTSSLTIKDVSVALSGTRVASDVRALGLVGLAAVVALGATRSWGRLVVGALTAAAGVAVVVIVARLLAGDLGLRLGAAGCERLCIISEEQAHPALHLLWPWLTLVGGVVLALAGSLVLVRGRTWAALSSSYENPATRAESAPETDKGVWDALDEGHDPTA